MKRVLFIGITYYKLQDNPHLRKKFEGLGKAMKVFVLARPHTNRIGVGARGRLSHQKQWEVDFYLLPKNFLFWPLSFATAFYLCLFKKIDVIVCQSPLGEGFIGTILKKILGKELIIEVHGDWVEGTFFSRKRRFEFLERKIVPRLARFSLKNTDKIRTISKFTETLATKISGDKPRFVFPAFTDLDIFLKQENPVIASISLSLSTGSRAAISRSNAKVSNYILFVGHLEKVKGVEYLIDAFNKISKEFPDFRLVLVGKGGQRENYQLSVINYQLQDRVKFTGELSLEKVRDIMKDCYCLVLPSLSEGLGRVLMEAMALGKPVIGTNVGGIPDLIRDKENGFLIEPENSNVLYEKIKILLQDRNLSVKMGQRGREIIKQNFSNQKYIDNYIKMINQ